MKIFFCSSFYFFSFILLQNDFESNLYSTSTSIFGNDYDRKKRRSQKALESLSQSVLEIIWLALFVSTFEPNFNFMIDKGIICILLAIGHVEISAIIASLMIFTE